MVELLRRYVFKLKIDSSIPPPYFFLSLSLSFSLFLSLFFFFFFFKYVSLLFFTLYLSSLFFFFIFFFPFFFFFLLLVFLVSFFLLFFIPFPLIISHFFFYLYFFYNPFFFCCFFFFSFYFPPSISISYLSFFFSLSFLKSYLWHTDLGTFRMVENHTSTSFAQDWNFNFFFLFGNTNIYYYNKLVTPKCFYCKETLLLQLKLLLYINQKVINHNHNVNLTVSVLRNYFSWSKTLHFINIVVNIYHRS